MIGMVVVTAAAFALFLGECRSQLVLETSASSVAKTLNERDQGVIARGPMAGGSGRVVEVDDKVGESLAIAALADRIRVSVVDTTEGRIPNAGVYLYSGGVVSKAGTTGVNGEPVDFPDGAFGTVFTRIEGMASQPRRLSSAVDLELSIRVEPGGHLGGLVLSASGLSAQEGTNVLLWRGAEGAMPSGVVSEALSGNPEYAVVATDSSGYFYIDGLKRNGQYSLIAGGGGEVSANPLHGVKVGDDNVILEMDRVYGTRVRLLTTHGKGVVIPEGTSRQCRFRTEPRVIGGHPVPLASWMLPLAGIVDQPGDGDGGVQLPLAYSSDGGEGQLGPFRLNAHIPGFVDVEIDFFLPASFGGEFPTVDVVMEGGEEYGGVLVAHFVGADHLVSGAANTRRESIGRIHLASYQGGHVFSFSDFGEDQVRMSNLPPGKYQLRYGVECAGGLLPLESGTALTVMVDDGSTDVSLDCGLFAMAVLSVGTAVDAYDGPLTILVKRDGDVDRFVHFSEAPYELPGLLAGRYSARIHLPTDRRSMEFKAFSVQDGEVLSVALE